MVLFLCIPSIGFASTDSPLAIFAIGNGQYNINGLSKEDIAPYIKNGRTYIPLRYAGYAVGIGDNSMLWDNKSKTAYLERNNTIIAIRVNEPSVYINKKKIIIDAKAELINGRIMVPLRAISEAFNCYVKWDQEKKIVSIY